MPAARARIESVGVAPVGGDRRERQPGVDQAPAGSCPRPRRARRSRDPPDHGLAGLGSLDDGAEADPEVEDAPQLRLGDVAGQPGEDRRALPRAPVDLGAAARGEDAGEVAGDAAAGDVRERLRAPAERRRPRRGRAAWARAGRGRRSPRARGCRRTSVKPLACTPAEAKPITASPAATALPSIERARSTMPTQVPAASSSPVAVDAGQLGGLAADQRDAGARGRPRRRPRRARRPRSRSIVAAAT